MNILIYTDGSARNNPGRGGWGCILMYGEKIKEFSGGYRKTTNNRMELLSVIEALKRIKRKDIPIIVYSDSKYVIDSVQKGWLKTWIKTNFAGGKKNKDLWLEYNTISEGFNITFSWVKGHASNVHNNRCDVLATTAADSKDLKIDEVYEKENR
jgi:ribonuclease HI